MQEELISFETAKLAKEKGFREPSHSYYFEDGEFKEHELTGSNGYYGEEYCFVLEEFFENWNNNWLTKKNGDRCFGCPKAKGYFETFSAPTQSFLQKWLRETHKIHVQILPYNYKYLVSILKYGQNGSNPNFDNEFDTYEEALEGGLFKALELI